MFIFPSLFFIKFKQHDKKSVGFVVAIIFIVVGVGFMILCNYFTFIEAVSHIKGTH